jgi:large subunit ribosomal protein L24
MANTDQQYYDSAVFSEAAQGLAPKHESAVPIPLDHVRLVVPGEIIQGSTKRYGDVMVEKIFMERHTTGIDPYNGTDYGDAEVPKHHQYDPRTGLPIFNRYISGTQHRIEWPWERVEDELAESEAPEESPEERRTWRTTLTQPFTSLARWRSKNKEVESAKQGEQLSAAEKFQEIELEEKNKARDMVPRSQDPDLPHAYDNIDTTRNNVEGLSVRYSLVSPPFPDTLGEELRSDIRDFSEKLRKDPDAPRASIKIPRNSEQGVLAREVAKAKHKAAEAMKTPMQLRWELEHKKKVDNLKKNPLVQEEELLAVLGQHIQKSKAKPYKGKKQFTEPVQELD